MTTPDKPYALAEEIAALEARLHDLEAVRGPEALMERKSLRQQIEALKAKGVKRSPGPGRPLRPGATEPKTKAELDRENYQRNAAARAFAAKERRAQARAAEALLRAELAEWIAEGANTSAIPATVKAFLSALPQPRQIRNRRR